MLTIREPQMETLGLASAASFTGDMMQNIAAEYPSKYAAMGDQRMREFVIKMLEEGLRHGIDTRGALMVFIELSLEFGEGFARSPDRVWAGRILAHPTLPAHVKMEVIRDRFDDTTQGRKLRVHGEA